MSKKKKKPNRPSKRGTKTKSGKTQNTRSRDIVKIIWKDHFSSNYGWTHVDDMDHRPHINVSVGIILHEDEEVVTVAANMMSENKAADTTTVLKNCIVQRSVLGVVEFGERDVAP